MIDAAGQITAQHPRVPLKSEKQVLVILSCTGFKHPRGDEFRLGVRRALGRLGHDSAVASGVCCDGRAVGRCEFWYHGDIHPI